MDELIGLFGVSEEDGNEHSYEAQLMSHNDDCQHQVQPEVEEGNVEFKLKLVNPTDSRMEHLVTQMKWRLREGHGEAIYQIGVEDRGAVLGLCQSELDTSLATLNKMAQRLNADITTLREVVVDPVAQTKAVEVLVRQIPSDKPFIDMRVCVLGNVDCGKSTLVGVLTTRQLDSGRGRARLNLLRHPHEIQTGHTSSVCHEIMGFDSHGKPVDYSVVRNKEEICEMSSKLITFIDLPGCQKSLKTTIFGLTGYYPDYALILIAANQGIVDTTREHFALALALNIPCAILITKADLLSPAALENMKAQIKNVLEFPGVDKMCLFVEKKEEAVRAVSKRFRPEQIVPVFVTSSVNGQGMDLVKDFLNIFPQRNVTEESSSCLSNDRVSSSFCGFFGDDDEDEDKEDDCFEHDEPDADFKIDETFFVPNVGCVVGGILQKGVIRRGDEMHLGPYEDGSFRTVKVASLHRTGRAPCSIVSQNQSAAIAIKPNNPVRKGMVLLASFGSGTDETQQSREKTIHYMKMGSKLGCFNYMSENGQAGTKFKASMELEAEILILFHPTKIQPSFQCTLHIDNIVQSAVIKSITLQDGMDLSPKRNKTVSLDGKEKECERIDCFGGNGAQSSSLPSVSNIDRSPPPTGRTRTSSSNDGGPCLTTNQKGHVTFRFLRHCEYIRPGMRILLRQGKTKGIGNITKVFPYIHGANVPEDANLEM